jgi:hypothetical protein
MPPKAARPDHIRLNSIDSVTNLSTLASDAEFLLHHQHHHYSDAWRQEMIC